MSDVYSQLPVGAVTAEEVANVFTEFIRDLDEVVWPLSDPTPSRTHVLAHFEALKFELFKRCRLKSAQADRPAVAVHAALEAQNQAAVASASNRDTWRARTQMGRDYAKAEALK